MTLTASNAVGASVPFALVFTITTPKPKETLDVFNYFLEFGLLDVCCVSGAKSLPLLLFVGIVVELGCKGDWRGADRR